MNGIITAALIVGIIGLLIGIALVAFGKKFEIPVNEKEVAVRDCLPGNNCGACGYAGCDAVAAAIAAGDAAPTACPVNNQENADRIAEIMGVLSSKAIRRVAFVQCAGDCNATQQKSNYIGIQDCRAAVLSGLNIWDCNYGCIGLGSCAAVCTEDAIVVKNGVAYVRPEKCIGCGRCVKACPKGLIALTRADKKVAVRCSNHDRGPDVKKVCTAGCLGCRLCTKQCEHNAITVNGNLARIDYDKCVGCGKCADKCPAKIIMRFGDAVRVVEAKS